MQNKIPIIIVAGPTASGKTQAGVQISKKFDGEVVSADSMQIYQRLSIGTAKPTLEEQGGIPHHLLDFLPPSQTFSVADYVKAAHEIIFDINSRGKLPVIVGGTGLYISSLVDNIAFTEEKSDPKLRQNLLDFARENGNLAVWEKLREIDPETAKNLHPNNLGRVTRAIEIFKATGTTMAEQKAKSRDNPSPYEPIMIGLSCRNRQVLYDRINNRVDKMLKNGLMDEAKWLLKNGYSNTSFQAIGYKEMMDYLNGTQDLEDAVERIKKGTRHYAKRQLTWFKKDERIKWFYSDDYDDDFNGLIISILEHISLYN